MSRHDDNSQEELADAVRDLLVGVNKLASVMEEVNSNLSDVERLLKKILKQMAKNSPDDE